MECNRLFSNVPTVYSFLSHVYEYKIHASESAVPKISNAYLTPTLQMSCPLLKYKQAHLARPTITDTTHHRFAFTK